MMMTMMKGSRPRGPSEAEGVKGKYCVMVTGMADMVGKCQGARLSATLRTNGGAIPMTRNHQSTKVAPYRHLGRRIGGRGGEVVRRDSAVSVLGS